MKYNPLLIKEMIDNDKEKHFTRRMLENSIWYSGDEQALSYFYRKEAPNFYRYGESSDSLNYFWKQSDSDFRRVHTGFPQIISETMTNLLIGNGYEMLVEGKNEEEIKEDLDNILDDNQFDTLLANSIETESWAGGMSWKLSKNPNISEYPIIEMWQPENYEPVIKSGRIIADKFYTYYEKNNITYRLTEEYGVDDKGAYIDYALHELQFEKLGQEKSKEKWVDALLTELEDTKDLKRLEFIGYKKKLSMYKANKLPNNEFRGSVLGASDYAGSYGAFDSIDEAWSTNMQEGRDGKLNRYFPEEFLPKNSKDETSFPNDFKVKHIVYSDSPMENTEKAKIQYSQGELRTDQHLEKYKTAVMIALNNAKLSPLTVGITGFESIDASAESQQEREKVSIRTRNKKIGGWKQFLSDMLTRVLEFHYMTKSMKRLSETKFLVGNLPEFEVKPTFEDYILKSMKDRTSEVTEGTGVVWDTLTAVQYVHKDKTKREQLAISARIKLESGIESLSKAEASALQDMNIEDENMLIEEGVAIIEEGQENEDGLDIEENDNEPVAEEIIEE